MAAHMTASTLVADATASNTLFSNLLVADTLPRPATDSAPIHGPTPSELTAMPNVPSSTGEPLRHILLGSPGHVRQTIHLLHTLRYVESFLWSPLVTIPNDQLIITPRPGEVMSLLIRHMS
jgi:hypothetical protein